ncbi:MAG: hypothetical protein AAF431_03800 [Pseudomonadota bacterium]
MNKPAAWHNVRSGGPIASVTQSGFMDQPGPHRSPHRHNHLPIHRGTVAHSGFHGVGPAAYHFQHHHPVYPSERRHQTCCHHHPHYRAADLRMQTWSSSTLLSYLYQSERRKHY